MEDVLFLLMFCGMPVLFIGALAFVAVNSFRSRRSWTKKIADTPWEVFEEDAALDAALSDLERNPDRRKVSSLARHPELGLMVLRYHPPRTASSSKTISGKRMLIFARPRSGPRGVVQRRSMIADKLVSLLGLGAPREAAGFEWALCFGPDAEFLPPEVGRKLDPLLADGETLRLGEEHVALVLIDGDPFQLLDSAEQRAAELRAALS